MRARLAFRQAVQKILQALGRVASDRSTKSLSLDKLTEAYIRSAAAAASTVEDQHAIKAFYFALAIAFDRGYLIKRYDAVAVKFGKNQTLLLTFGEKSLSVRQRFGVVFRYFKILYRLEC